MTENSERLGVQFATALAAKNFDQIHELLDDAVDFRALTPNRFWQAGDPDAVIAEILREWFEDSDEIEELVAVDAGEVAGRERVTYRLRVRNADGVHLVEQQAYLTERDGRIAWMRVLCAGFLLID